MRYFFHILGQNITEIQDKIILFKHVFTALVRTATFRWRSQTLAPPIDSTVMVIETLTRSNKCTHNVTKKMAEMDNSALM